MMFCTSFKNNNTKKQTNNHNTKEKKACLKKQIQLNRFTSDLKQLWEQEWWILKNKYLFQDEVLGWGYLLMLLRQATV